MMPQSGILPNVTLKPENPCNVRHLTLLPFFDVYESIV